MMHFTVELTCWRCKASIRFEDERPDWKTYDYRVEEAEECEKSAAFVVAWDGKPMPPDNETWPEWEAAGRPQFINRLTAYGVARGWEKRFLRDAPFPVALDIPEPYRYIECPVCDEVVREPNGGRW